MTIKKDKTVSNEILVKKQMKNIKITDIIESTGDYQKENFIL